MKTIELEVNEQFNISEFTTSGQLIALNCTQERDLVFVMATKELDYRENRSGASFAKITTSHGQNYRVFRSHGDNIVHITDIENESYNIHDVQLFTDQRILLVCGRSRYRSDHDYDKNGRLYSASGKYLNEILLGDGIQDIQIAENDIIWTSFFDEGVFGNFGWNNPIGSSGLVAWQATGEKVYEYHPTKELDTICDCYALNVESKNVTWCYYYTDFPLVKITSRTIENYWNIPIHGSRGVAIHQNYALFWGEYDDPTSLSLIHLGSEHHAHIEKRFSLKNVPPVERSCVRGDTIFMLAGNTIYKISLFEVLRMA